MLNMALKQKDKGKTTPVLDRSKASDISMAVLKRIDPEVEEVSLCIRRGSGSVCRCMCTLVNTFDLVFRC